MKILLISTCKEKLSEQEFVNPFVNFLSSKNIETKVIHHYSIKEKDFGNFDKIIICGTALADNDYLRRMDKFKWLKDIEKPVIGICSGAQIVASVFGSEIKKDLEIGMVKVSGNLFGKKEFDAYALHQNGICESSELEILATSETSIQATKHRQKEIYGIVFHPEVRNFWVVEKFLGL